jgi:hypothetical protein
MGEEETHNSNGDSIVNKYKCIIKPVVGLGHPFKEKGK